LRDSASQEPGNLDSGGFMYGDESSTTPAIVAVHKSLLFLKKVAFNTGSFCVLRT